MSKKYIDADAATEIREIDEEYFDTLERYNGTEFAEGFSEGWMDACDKIAKKIPAADVEKVIRCKNCQFARCEFSVVRHSGGILLCGRTGLSLLDGNGYCSWAELATDRPVEKAE